MSKLQTLLSVLAFALLSSAGHATEQTFKVAIECTDAGNVNGAEFEVGKSVLVAKGSRAALEKGYPVPVSGKLVNVGYLFRHSPQHSALESDLLKPIAVSGDVVATREDEVYFDGDERSKPRLTHLALRLRAAPVRNYANVIEPFSFDLVQQTAVDGQSILRRGDFLTTYHANCQLKLQ